MRRAQHPTSANATRSEQPVQNDDKMAAEDVAGNSLTGLTFFRLGEILWFSPVAPVQTDVDLRKSTSIR